MRDPARGGGPVRGGAGAVGGPRAPSHRHVQGGATAGLERVWSASYRVRILHSGPWRRQTRRPLVLWWRFAVWWRRLATRAVVVVGV
jgi:hypothetical protein